MQGQQKNRLKRAIDLAVTVLLLCLMAYQVTGEALHEWCGVSMTVLLFLHHALNFRWHTALFKGRYTPCRAVSTAVNMLLLVSIAATAVCGMAMSAHAVPFLYGLLPVSFARQYHLAASHWSFVLMGLHLGMHVPAMAAGMKMSGKAKTAAAAVCAVIAARGLRLFCGSGIADYMLFRTPFAFLDYDKAPALVFAENLAMLLAFAFFGACCALFLQALGGKCADRGKRLLVPLLAAAAAALIAGAWIGK